MLGYQKKTEAIFEGIDLKTFDKEEYIKNFDNVVIPGIYVLVAIYADKVKKVTLGGVIIPEGYQEKEGEYYSSVGLFIKAGKEAYLGSQFPSGPYAVPGDWVMFNRGACTQNSYNGLPFIITEAHKIRMIVEDPSKIGK